MTAPRPARQSDADRSQAPGGFANSRPKDAGALILLRRDRDAVRVLMGRRSSAHVFMPGLLVFPGGRMDPGDRLAPTCEELHPAVEAKLLRDMKGRRSAGRARALALAAIRETFEETGILVGRPSDEKLPLPSCPQWRPFLAHGVVPRLAPLRLVARAITPPGRSRRFDARFFAVFAEEIGRADAAANGELEDVAWRAFAEARSEPLPEITRMILDDLEARLRTDPTLEPEVPAPFHFMRGRHFVREAL